MDFQAFGEKLFLQIKELDEFCNDAYENAKIYKEWTKAWYDKHILKKEFYPDNKFCFTIHGIASFQESSNRDGGAHSWPLKFFPMEQ